AKKEDWGSVTGKGKKGESGPFWGFLAGEYKYGIKPEGKYKPEPWKKQDWRDNEVKKDWTRHEAWDMKTGERLDPDKVKYAKEIGGATLFNAAAQIGGSLFEFGAEGKGEYAQGKYSVKFGTAEAHAGISGGLYGYDKDGKATFAPAIKAEIGTSISAFKADGEGRIGLGENNDMLGVYGKGEVSALKAEAGAKGEFALFGEKGPQANVKASAEAHLAEAKGSVGATVLGADIGVSGSVNVGVGAHAEVGIVDGKVKVDVGASLGVGFSVGFEVDVGGTIKAVSGAVESGWKALTGLFGG
ncbi:MAG: hypothetical protein FWG03_11615, partial [Clostridiales bacterium]|nr:hypothetical protein [Clostridiales bacterium]